jgi:thiol:disulfide interchange protein
MRTLLAALFFATALFADPEYPHMGPDIYDTHANGDRQIKDALERAGAENKRVIVDFGANWCIWCRRLHHTFESDPAVARRLRESFVLVMVDINSRHGDRRNADIDARYGNPVRFGIPVLVVLGADGRLLTTKDSGELEEGDHHSPRKILEFLERWSPGR